MQRETLLSKRCLYCKSPTRAYWSSWAFKNSAKRIYCFSLETNKKEKTKKNKVDRFLKALLSKHRPGLHHIWKFSPQIYSYKPNSSEIGELSREKFDDNYIREMFKRRCKSDVCRCKKDLLIILIKSLKRKLRKEKIPFTSCINLNALIHFAQSKFKKK